MDGTTIATIIFMCDGSCQGDHLTERPLVMTDVTTESYVPQDDGNVENYGALVLRMSDEVKAWYDKEAKRALQRLGAFR